MPTEPEPAVEAPLIEGPVYPSLEAYVESATREEIGGLYASVREGLAGLKGPRAEQGKRVETALFLSEDLLTYLFEVRERLEEERKSGQGAK